MFSVDGAEQPSRAGANADAFHCSAVAVVADNTADQSAQQRATPRVAGKYLGICRKGGGEKDQREEEVFHGTKVVTRSGG